MQNPLDPESCKYFIPNTTLVRLSLTNTPIRDYGAALLAKNKTLEELILFNCYIGDPGAIAISQNNSFTRVVLTNNYITEAGIAALFQNNNFLHLSLSGNPFRTIPAKLKQRYMKISGDTFERDETFVNALLKKDFEEKHPNIFGAGLTSTSSSPLPFTPHRTALQAQQPSPPSSPAEITAAAIVAMPFFTSADPEQVTSCFRIAQEMLSSSSAAKKRKADDRNGITTV